MAKRVDDPLVKVLGTSGAWLSGALSRQDRDSSTKKALRGAWERVASELLTSIDLGEPTDAGHVFALGYFRAEMDLRAMALGPSVDLLQFQFPALDVQALVG